MTSVRVPPELYAVLAAPLALRGLLPTLEDADIVIAADRCAGVHWLALAADEQAAIAALDAGAADVVLAGEGPALIAARAARLARPPTITVGELSIDPVARTATRAGRPLDLLPREYAVLRYLARHADRLVTRSALRAAVWGQDFDSGTNVIEVHVSRVRATLDRDGPPLLLTERGQGYRLVSAPALHSGAIAARRRAS